MYGNLLITLPFQVGICSCPAWTDTIAYITLRREREDSRRVSDLQSNRGNTISKPAVVSWRFDLLMACTVLVIEGNFEASEKFRTLKIFIFHVTKIYIGLEETYSFLAKQSVCQFSAALFYRLISLPIT